MSNSVIGNPSEFAIDWGITQSYQKSSLLALGWFTVWLSGRRYGIKSPSASMLACSFDEVRKRLSQRGEHRAFFQEEDADLIVQAFRSARYKTSNSPDLFFGVTNRVIEDEFIRGKIQWCPDGDEAFDDGSHILHFDSDKHVRLIGFNNMQSDENCRTNVIDCFLSFDIYYNILSKFLTEFAMERNLLLNNNN